MCSVSYRLGSNRIPILSVQYVNMHMGNATFSESGTGTSG